LEEKLINQFYTAFKNLDAETMVSLYHDDIMFEDPAFGILKGEEAKAMWKMLIESQKGKNFQVSFSNIQQNGKIVTANWEAKDEFGKSKKKVHNKIQATFWIENGKISKHIDHFNLHTWAKQAMGFQGWIIGGTNLFKNKLNQQTRKMLHKYLAKQNLQ